MTVNERIFFTLQQQKRKQNELAEFLGANIVTVSKWKSKKISPSVEHLAKIAEFLGCSTDYLIFGKEELNTPILNTEIGNINGNNNSSNNNFFTNGDANLINGLTEYKQELLNVVDSLSYKKKNALLSYAYQLQEEN